jgi:hypothetical protein
MSKLITETSHKKGSLSASLMDIFGGFSGFVAVKVVSIATRQHQDIRPFLIATCLAFSIASFYRAGGKPSRIPASALLVALGGIMPAIVINRLGMSWTSPHLLFLFVVTSTASVALGASLRTLILLGRMRLALSLGGISMIAALLLVLRTVPSWLASDAYRHVDRNISVFHVQSFEGKSLASSDWKGHVVIVSFWATWCLPLIRHAAVFQGLSPLCEMVKKVTDFIPGTLCEVVLDMKNRAAQIPSNAAAAISKCLNPARSAFFETEGMTRLSGPKRTGPVRISQRS